MRLVPIIRRVRLDLQRHRERHRRQRRVFHDFLHHRQGLSTSASGASNTSSSCTCSSIARSVLLASASCMRIMARRMMSAAVPCSGALIAARSSKARTAGFEALISG